MKSSHFLLLLFLLALSACRNTPDQPSNDEAFSSFIKAYTTGHISRTSSIRIIFDAQSLRPGITASVDPSWLSIEPTLEGELVWTDQQVLEFRPFDWMPSGSTYKARLQLDEIIEDTPPGTFDFGWRTFDQGFTVDVSTLTPYQPNDLNWYFLEGNLRSADDLNNEELAQSLEALQSGKALSISWNNTSGRIHHFSVDSIRRDVEAGQVFLNWNGEALGCDIEGSLQQEVPGLADFKVLMSTAHHEPDQYVSVVFSDPLDTQQDLSGYFVLGGNDRVRLETNLNEVRIYPYSKISGSVNLEIMPGIQNIAGYSTKESSTFNLRFESMKPSVRLHNADRTILPSSNRNNISFEAVSLSAVDVRVIRIYEDNIHQFLQTNHLSGSDDLKRVGRVIRRKTIALDTHGKDLSQWNRFFLDMNELVELEPGAIYRVEIGFRMQHSVYPCDMPTDSDQEEILTASEDWDSYGEEESSYWDYFDSWYYSAWNDYYWEYDYTQRDNPCHETYYRQYRQVSRNFITSDIGITAKRGSNDEWHVWTTDLLTAKPLSGVEISFLNFQGQALHNATSDASGHVIFNGDEKTPFLVVAQRGNEKSYLRLANGQSLSLSTFDVSGAATNDGMKGFIYGERGVWRPGDTLFLSFMLEDAAQRIPASHPVSLEIIDARNRSVYKDISTLNKHQHLAWVVPTEEDAPTGNWQARVRIGNAVFHKYIRVETIKPNRLKIDLNFGKDYVAAGDAGISGDVRVSWLHGAPARQLRTQIEMGMFPTKTSFGKFSDFVFDDPARRIDAPSRTVFDQQVDDQGNANVTIELRDLKDAPGMLNAVFNTRAYEAGGDFSIDVFSLKVSPFNYYVGLRLPKGDRARNMLLTDTTHQVQVRTVDADGNVTARKKLRYEVYKIEWRWWWNHRDDLGDYIGRNSSSRIASGEFETKSNGEGSFPLRINYPDWGRYLVRVIDTESGHASGQVVYIDWPGWAGRAQRENPEGESMLMISTDKVEYKLGETITASFPGAADARALITIEDASGIIASDWMETTSGSNTYTFEAINGLAPNVYLSVSLIQAHAQTANDHPIRMYGVQRVKITDPSTTLTPHISTSEEFTPESTYRVKVSEKEGRAMSYTLAVVDEGLLGLTRFKTPDPHAHFYAQEALGVSTWDLFDDVIDAYSGEMKPLLSVGGDAELTEVGKKKIDRFKPVVTFIGPFSLESGATATHELFMPNYVGAVRVMVVAREGQAYGHTEKMVPVRKPLMVLGTLPRVLGPSESVELPVTVFAMDQKVRKVEVEVKVNGLLFHEGSQKQIVSFSQNGDQVVNFELGVKDLEGVAKVEIIAKSGGETARHEIELEVRNPNPPVTVRYRGVINAGEYWSKKFDLPGMAGSNELKVEISAFKPVNLGSRLDYLLGYPHGCAEQTTSRAFPQLYLAEAVEMTEEQKDRAEANVRMAVERMQGFQRENGGFSYWRSHSYANDWTTSYVGHFLLEAKAKGYNVPDKMVDRWIKYQNTEADRWRDAGRNSYENYGLPQAYRLFTLALAGKPNMTAMNRMRQSNMSATSRWQLAAAYILAGKPEIAEDLTKGASVEALAYEEPSQHFGSLDRDRALIAEALLIMGKREEAGIIINKVCERMDMQRWYSTQEIAFSLVAIGRFMADESKEPMHYQYRFNSDDEAVHRPTKLTSLESLTTSKQRNNTFHIENLGNRTLYVQITATGEPVEDTTPAIQQGVTMDVRYFTIDGHDLDVSSIEQGTDFIAEVSVYHNNDRKSLRDVALTQIFPSGWEILNDRLLTAGSDKYQNSWSEHRDIRDDRIYTYFSLPRNKPQVYYVRLNAAYIGRFYLPATAVELMYDGDTHARTQGQWITVRQAGVL